MSASQPKHIASGILAGIIGGLVASWVMNQFIAGPGQALTHAVQTDDENRQQAAHAGEPHEDATMKTADALVNVASGGRHLSWEGREHGGPVVHYTFGALMGGLYGGLAEVFPAVKTGAGTTFGSVLFTGADLVAVPALHLSGSPAASPIRTLATPYAAHLVYGVTTELVRRLTRAAL